MSKGIGIKQGILYVFGANLLNLIISLAKGFLLPKFISIEAYADIQTYLLYVSYVGLLHFGYLDGLYLKYGGKEFEEIGEKEFNICRFNTFILQLLITLPTILISKIINSNIVLLFAMSILPLNMTTLYKNLFQATGQFKRYSRILNFSSIISFLGTMILLFAVKTDNALLYIVILMLADYIVWMLLEYKINKDFKIKLQFICSLKHFVKYTKNGIVLMLGNFSSVIMTGIDRWFVKFALTTVEFAYYSFAVRIENLLTVFITPIVTTMYNYLCKNDDKNKIIKIKNICLIVGIFIIGSAFPVKFVLEHFLQKYQNVKNILFILFAIQVFYLIIKGIYVNLYKVRGKQTLYFRQLLEIIIIGIIFNFIALKIKENNVSIAIATFLSVIIWLKMCSKTIPEIKFNLKNNILLYSSLLIFIILGINVNSIVGFIIYYIYIVIATIILNREDFLYIIEVIKEIVINIKNKYLKKESDVI